jgi:TRAP-type uncharacterized transport system fused permease subunit
VPFAFVLLPEGQGLLLQGGPLAAIVATVAGCVAVAALAVATGGWLVGPARPPERLLMGAGAIAFLAITPVAMAIGAVAIVAGLSVHLLFRSRRPGPAVT